MRCRQSFFRRLLERLGLRSCEQTCGDFLLEEPPPDIFVREPRRPTPIAPYGAVALELPDTD